MRIYDILNPYKLLCEEAQKLEEALTTDFSIGFELEGVCTREGFSHYDLPGYHSRREPRGVVKELFDDINRELGFGTGKIESDSSLHPSSEKGGWTFEYGSPIIPFNPANINKIYNFLKKLPELQVYTNDSCGFHTHMSFKGIDKTNAAWVMCCLSIDENLQNELRELKTVKNMIPFATDWSSAQLFDDIKRELKSKDYSDISNLLDSDRKYNLVRVHPAGTLEWRGPRNFLNNADIDEIHEYIKKIYRVILGISKIINSKTYTGSGITIDKKEIEKRVHVTDDFESPEQKRIDAKSSSFYDKFKQNPLILNSLRGDRLYSFISSKISNIANLIGYYGNTRDFCNKLAKLKPQVLNELLSQLLKFNARYFWEFIEELTEENLNVINVLDKKTLKLVISSALNRYIKRNESDYYDNLTNTNILKNNPDIVLEILSNLPLNKYAIRVINDSNINLPLEYYKKILNSKEFYKLSYFDNLPVKIQRMMVRKSPYMVQYISHIDPQILAALKQKYPDIEQHILGEI